MRIRLLVAALLALLASGVAGSFWFFDTIWGRRSSAKVEIEIDEGSSARRILRLLEREGVAGSTLASRLYLRGWGRGRTLHYGRYVFDAGMRPVDVLETVLDGRVDMFALTIVEGSDSEAISELFVSFGVGSADEWRSLIGRVDWIAAVAPEAPSLEGFLFPDTYRFAVGTSADNASLSRHWSKRKPRSIPSGPWLPVSISIVYVAACFCSAIRRWSTLSNAGTSGRGGFTASTGKLTTRTTPIATPVFLPDRSTHPAAPPWPRRCIPNPRHTSTSSPNPAADMSSHAP